MARWAEWRLDVAPFPAHDPLRTRPQDRGTLEEGTMRIVGDIGTLDARSTYWVPALTAPARDWAAAPGCRRGARFLIDGETYRPAHDHFPAFDSRAECLRWIMAHRADIAGAAPDAPIHAARLDAWMLGLDATLTP